MRSTKLYQPFYHSYQEHDKLRIGLLGPFFLSSRIRRIFRKRPDRKLWGGGLEKREDLELFVFHWRKKGGVFLTIRLVEQVPRYRRNETHYSDDERKRCLNEAREDYQGGIRQIGARERRHNAIVLTAPMPSACLQTPFSFCQDDDKRCATTWDPTFFAT